MTAYRNPARWIAIGIGIGVAPGVVMKNIGTGIAIGVLIATIQKREQG